MMRQESAPRTLSQRSATSLHVSTVQASVSAHERAGPVQAPAPLQVSGVEHHSPSSQLAPAGPGGCAQEPEPLHWSSVHGFESAGQAVPAGTLPFEQTPVATLQVSVVHGFRSLQSALVRQQPPRAVFTQPVDGLQVSEVQTLPSSQLMDGCTQTPAASHRSFVQRLPSSGQDVPAASGV
jgi:hypothetical protein